MDQIQNNNNNKKRSMTQRNSRFLLPHNPTSGASSSSSGGNNNNNNVSSTPSSSNSSSNTLNLSTNKNNLDDFQFEDSNQHSVDTDFDSYWEEEARCPHRNRIRIGRQYQPSVPAMLKPGESDNRDLKDLETLTFCPRRSAQLSDPELDHYFTIAKSLNLFASLVETRSLLGRDVTIADLNRIRHKEGLSLASVIQPVRQCSNANITPSIVSPTQTSKSPPNSTNCDNNNSKLESPAGGSPTNSSNLATREQLPLGQQDNYAFNLPLMKALSHFINLHHPCHHDRDCKKLLKDVPLMDDSGPAVSITAGNLRHGTSAASKSSRSRSLAAKQQQAAQQLIVKEEPVSSAADHHDDHHHHPHPHEGVQSPTFEEWTREEVELFSKAIEICGKNFSSIKKEFLPSKSVKSIVEYYYIGSRDVSENKKKLVNQPAMETSDSCSSPEKMLAINQQLQPAATTADGGLGVCGNEAGCGPSAGQVKRINSDPRMSVYNFDEEFKDDTNDQQDVKQFDNLGAEVKPLKAKPIIPNSGLDANGANPNVGSLEFFMDGQLVLKLNACQDKQEGMDKCHWVQSGEKVAGSERRQKKYSKRASDKVATTVPTTTTTPTPLTTPTTDAYHHQSGDLYDKVLFDQRR